MMKHLSRFLETTLENSDSARISASLGIGKTRAAIESCDNLGYKFLVVTSNVSSVIEVRKKYGLSPYYEREKYLSDRMVTTYESFTKLIEKGYADRFDAIILDDYHSYLLKRGYRNFSVDIIDNFLTNTNKKKIFLSFAQEVMWYVNDQLWDMAIGFFYPKPSSIRIVELNYHTVEDYKSIFYYIANGNYDVVLNYKVIDYFRYCLHDYELVHSRNIHKQYDRIFDENGNLVKRIYTTHCFNAGLNVMNTGDLRIAIVAHNLPLIDLIQFLGRFRRARLYVDIYCMSGYQHRVTTKKVKYAGKVVDFTLNNIVDNKNIKELEKYFTCEYDSINEDVLSSHHFTPQIKKLFFPSIYYYSESSDVFIKYQIRVRNNRHAFYTFKDYIENQDKYKLDEVLLEHHPELTIRTLKKLLELSGFQIEPIKKNRRIIGYRIIK